MNPADTSAPKTKWPRSQRFQLSPIGREAGANYRDVIVAARAEAGRPSFTGSCHGGSLSPS